MRRRRITWVDVVPDPAERNPEKASCVAEKSNACAQMGRDFVCTERIFGPLIRASAEIAVGSAVSSSADKNPFFYCIRIYDG